MQGASYPRPRQRPPRHDALAHPALGRAQAAHGAPPHDPVGGAREAAPRQSPPHTRVEPLVFDDVPYRVEDHGALACHRSGLGGFFMNEIPQGRRLGAPTRSPTRGWARRPCADGRARPPENGRDLVRGRAMEGLGALPLDAPRLAAEAPILTLGGVWLRYGEVQALRGVHVEVQPGEVLGIVGESGSGKSTLLRLMNLEETPDRGRVPPRPAGRGGRPLRAAAITSGGCSGRATSGSSTRTPTQGLRMRHTSSGNVAERLLIAGERRFRGPAGGARRRRPGRLRVPARSDGRASDHPVGRDAAAGAARQGDRARAGGAGCSTSPPRGSTSRSRRS